MSSDPLLLPYCPVPLGHWGVLRLAARHDDKTKLLFAWFGARATVKCIRLLTWASTVPLLGLTTASFLPLESHQVG